ncbi:MAG: phosphate ABC transporter permease PstA [Oscillospiraceae bacterium]|jgi:phosphate transport system permease protein|nr:phosphate ABC transporter permease PstA [Oscillospiraceae bacterium]
MKLSAKSSEKIAKSIIWAAAMLVVAVLAAIVIYILAKGLPTLSWSFLTEIPEGGGAAGGIASPIVGTVLVTAVAVLIATPLGVGTAVYLAEYTKGGAITKIIRFSAESLAGIPSIVYGLFGFIFFVMYLGLGWSILSGGLTLAIMILPTIIRTSEEAIRGVPGSYRETSFSLGATKWQTIYKVVFPAAIQGITNGIILSVGRSVAETAALVLTAGSSLRMPTSLFAPTRTMAVHFYTLAMEDISPANAFGTAALLIILIFIINVGANILLNRFISNKGKKKEAKGGKRN